MAVTIACPHCHESLMIDEARLGRRDVCPACGEAFVFNPIEAVRTVLPPGRRLCPACGNDAILTARQCPTCGEAFPAPHFPLPEVTEQPEAEEVPTADLAVIARAAAELAQADDPGPDEDASDDDMDIEGVMDADALAPGGGRPLAEATATDDSEVDEDLAAMVRHDSEVLDLMQADPMAITKVTRDAEVPVGGVVYRDIPDDGPRVLARRSLNGEPAAVPAEATHADPDRDYDPDPEAETVKFIVPASPEAEAGALEADDDAPAPAPMAVVKPKVLIVFKCESCGKSYKLRDAKLAGRRMRCKQCGTAMTVPEPEE